MKYLYTLDKWSSPGWELNTDHLEHVYEFLDRGVCKSCKITKEEFEKLGDWENDETYTELLDSDTNPYTYAKFLPETFDSFGLIEKIEWLLNTACGCEYGFEKNFANSAEWTNSGVK